MIRDGNLETRVAKHSPVDAQPRTPVMRPNFINYNRSKPGLFTVHSGRLCGFY